MGKHSKDGCLVALVRWGLVGLLLACGGGQVGQRPGRGPTVVPYVHIGEQCRPDGAVGKVEHHADVVCRDHRWQEP